MKRAVRMALMLMASVTLAGNSMVFSSLATEDEVYVIDIDPRTEPEGGETVGGESGGNIGDVIGGGSIGDIIGGGSIGGDSGSMEGSGNVGGDTGSAGGNGSVGGDTGSTEGSGNVGDDSGSTGGSGSAGGDSGSTEGSGSVGDDTGSAGGSGSVGGDSGSTGGSGSIGGDTGSTEGSTDTGGNTGSTEGSGNVGGNTGSTEGSGNVGGNTGSTEGSTGTGGNTGSGSNTGGTGGNAGNGNTGNGSGTVQPPAVQPPVVVPGQNVQHVTVSQTESGNQPEDNALYSDYLGTGEGWEQLKVITDGEGLAKDYEMFLIQDAVIFCIEDDMENTGETWALTLSGAQLEKLSGEKEYLVLEAGRVMLTVQTESLLSGNTAKFAAMALSGEQEITAESVRADFSAMEEVILDEEQLAAVEFEFRIAESEAGYDVSAWMVWGEQEIEISPLVSDANIAMDVEGQFAEEEKTDYAMKHSVEWTDEWGNITWKASALVSMPEALIGRANSSVGCFSVNRIQEFEIPDITFEEAPSLEAHSHEVLMASYTGSGTYGIS